MFSSQEKIALYSKLQKVLGHLLEEQGPGIKVLKVGDYPLLVLEILNVVVLEVMEQVIYLSHTQI